MESQAQQELFEIRGDVFFYQCAYVPPINFNEKIFCFNLQQIFLLI